MEAKQSTKKPSRHQTRFVCVQAVIQGLLTDFEYDLEDHLRNSKIHINTSLCRKIYHLVIEHGQMLTDLITQKLQSKDFNTLNNVCKAVLYCALAEFIYMRTPIPVLISEYVTLTKRFLDDRSYKLVHGFLDSLKFCPDKAKHDTTAAEEAKQDAHECLD